MLQNISLVDKWKIAGKLPPTELASTTQTTLKPSPKAYVPAAIPDNHPSSPPRLAAACPVRLEIFYAY
jgi:hypothetical protein